MEEYLYSYLMKILRNSYIFIFLGHVNSFYYYNVYTCEFGKIELRGSCILGGQTALWGGRLPPQEAQTASLNA